MNRDKNNIYWRHLLVGVVAILLALPFWYGRLDWEDISFAVRRVMPTLVAPRRFRTNAIEN